MDIGVIFPRKMKVFDSFGAKAIKWEGSDFVVEKVEKKKNEPSYNLIKHRREA